MWFILNYIKRGDYSMAGKARKSKVKRIKKVQKYILDVEAKFKSKQLTKKQADAAKKQLKKNLKGAKVKVKKVK